MFSLESNWLMLFQPANPVFQMPRVKGVSDLHYRNGYAMIAFITEIQEPTDNRG